MLRYTYWIQLKVLFGGSLRALMQEGVKSGAFDARAARRAVLVGLASGVLLWQP